MKSVKSENGAITILVLVSVLFMISFLISAYVIIANKVQAQKDIISETKNIYQNYNLEDIYNNYFGKNIIPISNVEQLLAIGTGQNTIIDGKYYKFSNDEDTIYLLANDIEFNAYDEESLIDENGDYYWLPIGDNKDLLANFEGNGNEIKVKYKDEEDTEYTVVYSEKENFKEPQYKVKINPRLLSEDGVIANDATIWVATGDSQDFVSQELKGKIEINVKRRTNVRFYATYEGYKNSEIANIFIENPNKIQEYNLVLGKYIFTINPTPSNAKVTINGMETNTVSVNKGETVTWKVELDNYFNKEGSQVINEDTSIDVSLDKIIYTLKIEPIPSNANVTISSNGNVIKSGTGTQTVEVDRGTTINYSVNCTYYYGKSSEDITMNSNQNITVELQSKPEQTILLNPSGVSGSFAELQNANKSETIAEKFAYTTGTNELTWNFNASVIPSNSKITGMTIRYRLATTIAGTKANLTLKSSGNTYFTKQTGNLYIVLEGHAYEDQVTTLPSADEMRKSLSLSAKKSNSGLSYFRCYGASVTIKYIEP